LPTVMSMGALPSLHSLCGRGILARATAKVYTSPACAAVRLRIQPLHFSRRHARIRHRHRRGMAGEPGRKRT